MSIYPYFILITLSCIDALSIYKNHDPKYVDQIIRLSKGYEIRNYLNETVDPCENFYEFACGNWIKLNPANTADKMVTGFFEMSTEGLNKKILKILDNDIEDNDDDNNDDNDSKDNDGIDALVLDIDVKMKNLYKSCMNIKQLNSTYQQKLFDIIAEFGQLPVLTNNWNETDFDWLATIGRIFHKYGISIIISGEAMVDYTNNTRNMVYVGHPTFPLESRSLYVNEDMAVYREGYVKSMSHDIEVYLGLNKSIAKSLAKEVFNFEIELAKGMEDSMAANHMDDICTLIDVETLTQKYAPILDIKRLLNISFGHRFNGTVYEIYEDYQKNLVEVLKRTPKRTVANYIFYTLINDFIVKEVDSVKKQRNHCVTYIKKHFAKVLDNMVYRKYIESHTESDVLNSWYELKRTFKNILDSDRVNWMEERTRYLAKEKLDAMRLEISSYSDSNFSVEFHDLHINSHDYVDNLKNIKIFLTKVARDKMYKPPESLDVGEILSYTPVNMVFENKITIPVALLQPYYLWANNYPNALKYGTVGTLVGHEIIHGFDDSGRTFDKNGNAKDWWDKNSSDSFKERLKCFIKQYHQYIYGGRPLPEMPNQSENIADNGGLRIAFEAYRSWYETYARNDKMMKRETFPYLNYTNHQLFFISYAQLWCSDAHPAMLSIQTSTDVHVPSKYRVIGPLSNFPEFSKAFNCSEGTNMNPSNKCIIY